jgi:hypothetical protein
MVVPHLFGYEENIEGKVSNLINAAASTGNPEDVTSYDENTVRSALMKIEEIKDRALVVKRLQIILTDPKSSEKVLLHAANVLGNFTDDAQSIELMIDVVNDLRKSDILRKAIKNVIERDEILTLAQKKRLE